MIACTMNHKQDDIEQGTPEIVELRCSVALLVACLAAL